MSHRAAPGPGQRACSSRWARAYSRQWRPGNQYRRLLTPVAGGGQEVKGVMGEKIEKLHRLIQRKASRKSAAGTPSGRSKPVRKKRGDHRERGAQEKTSSISWARDMDDLLKTKPTVGKVDLNGKEAVLAVKDARLDRYDMSLRQKGAQRHRRPEYRLHFDDGGLFSGCTWNSPIPA